MCNLPTGGAMETSTRFEPLVHFSQLSITIDNTTITNTNWGAAHVSYMPMPEAQYFNLTVNETWTVQNIPLITTDDPTERISQTLYFNLGIKHGVVVEYIDFGWSIGSKITRTMPPVSA